MLFTTAVQAARRKAQTRRGLSSIGDRQSFGSPGSPRYFQPLPLVRR